MTGEEIEEIIKDFGRATKRAMDAGFDGVEIHGANHYGIQQFFSAYSNKRIDKCRTALKKAWPFPLLCLKKSSASCCPICHWWFYRWLSD